jgi:Mn2+/Fe2+ NRAMP family transporter
MGWEAGINKDFKEAPQFMWLYTGLIILGGGLVLIPKAPLILIMLLSQVINGLLLPFILIFILLLINRVKLMGAFKNSPLYNKVSWAAVGILILLSLALLWFSIQELMA